VKGVQSHLFAAGGDVASPKVAHDVAAITKKIAAFLDSPDPTGKEPCNARCGIYVFYDYDAEPIYVGQTNERLRVRIRRHLTNQRTDAVAMNVLDPFEVAEIEVYPFYELEQPQDGESRDDYKSRVKSVLASAEHTVFKKVLAASALGAVLNEANIANKPMIELPAAFRGTIIPDELYEQRKHPDVRLARRARTIANLAQVISERDVSGGLRRTLVTQARRLELLARKRLEDFITDIPTEEPGEETGEEEK
jgi:hypothetical protein